MKTMAYAVLRIQKMTTTTALINRYNHDFRESQVWNADENKKSENKILVKNQYGTYEDAFKAKVAASKIYSVAGPPRKDAVKAIDVMMTFSKEALNGLNLEQWEKESIKWLENTFGKDNVVSVVEHNDESVPHIHAVVIPMVNERLNASSFIGAPWKMSELQTSYGKAMAPLGLQRGIEKSVAKHVTMQAMYGAINKAMDLELPNPEKKESLTDYRNRANEVYKELALRCAYFERQAEFTHNKNASISLNERLDFENEKKEFENENSEIKELYELVRTKNPGFPIKETVEAISNIDNYLAEHPEEQNDIMKFYETLQSLMTWDDNKKKRKEKSCENEFEYERQKK